MVRWGFKVREHFVKKRGSGFLEPWFDVRLKLRWLFGTACPDSGKAGNVPYVEEGVMDPCYCES